LRLFCCTSALAEIIYRTHSVFLTILLTVLLTYFLSLGTSIGLVPSGRLAVAGFTDGTLRLFDLTGHFAKDKNHPQTNSSSSGGRGVAKDIMTSTDEDLFDDDASTTSSSFQEEEEDSRNTSFKSKAIVDSHSNQRYGAVACQIHARGVHTSLLMDVAISEDGLYAFGGVQRGSVELVAVYLGDVENYFDEQSTTTSGGGKQPSSSSTVEKVPGLLDLIHVDRHADAKLKGFGACTRLWNGWERARNGVERPEYLLFTGKGIKVREDAEQRYSTEFGRSLLILGAPL
jgi:hypothetical protein